VIQCDLVKKRKKYTYKAYIKTEKWPVTKNILISKHLKQLKIFIDSIDFEKLQSEGNLIILGAKNNKKVQCKYQNYRYKSS
jgi:hypothetical protein